MSEQMLSDGGCVLEAIILGMGSKLPSWFLLVQTTWSEASKRPHNEDVKKGSGWDVVVKEWEKEKEKVEGRKEEKEGRKKEEMRIWDWEKSEWRCNFVIWWFLNPRESFLDYLRKECRAKRKPRTLCAEISTLKCWECWAREENQECVVTSRNQKMKSFKKKGVASPAKSSGF